MAACLQNSNLEQQSVMIRNISGIRSDENHFGQTDFKICCAKGPAKEFNFRDDTQISTKIKFYHLKQL